MGNAAALLCVLWSVALRTEATTPLLSRVRYRVHTVDILFHPVETVLDGDMAPLLFRYEVAVLHAFADQALFLNGTTSIPDVNHFLQLHFNHRQLLYGMVTKKSRYLERSKNACLCPGLTRLDCANGQKIESHPSRGMHSL